MFVYAIRQLISWGGPTRKGQYKDTDLNSVLQHLQMQRRAGAPKI